MARFVKQGVAKLPEMGGILGDEGGIIGGVGVAEAYPDGPFLYLFKPTKLSYCETWETRQDGHKLT